MSVATQQTIIDPGPSQELQVEKFADGAITCVKFSGSINEKFEGKKLAATIRAKKLVLDLGNIQRISSFGVREWLDFVAVLNRSVEELVLINCSPKVMNQLNMVADFTGKGLVFSFLAPYRCDYCETDRMVLLNVDRDHESISKMKAPERQCDLCGNAEDFDDEPITYFTFVANQKDFELDPAIGNFLIAKLGYSVSDLARRMHAEKMLEGRFMMMKLAGNLDGSFPGDKLAEGVEGTVVVDVSGVGGVDPAGAAEFRKFVSLMKPHIETMYLVGCEAMFLERTLQPEDLGGKVQVLSFALPFHCAKCNSSSSHVIDVEEHHDVLKIAMAPQQKCDDCRGPTTCQPADATRALMPALPKPSTTPELRKFIKKAQKTKKKTEEEAPASAAVTRSMMILLPVALLAIGVMGFFVFQQQKKSEEMVQQAVTSLNQASKKRPAWITSDVPFSSYCTDLSNRITCVGVSSYLPSKEAAKIEAANAALESLANTVALRIENPAFRQFILPEFRDTRQLALGDLEDARANTASADFERAVRIVRDAHRNVAAALKRTGGTAVPAQIADWYWEEYERLDGDGTEFRAFVRYDLTPASITALKSAYALHSEVLGVKALTTYPAMAWQSPDAAVGAIVVEVNDGPLQKFGIGVRDVFLAVGDGPVRDAEDFSAKMTAEHASKKDRGGKMKFVVKDSEGTTKEFDGPIGSKPVRTNQGR